ncbi:hypothetical protein [Flavivirga eckloniae]|uniref:Uncharacterized protein n=1 Tax=Flavivirga eckloniae TaxID=1803846 RepID=A0A2K9PT43_9FLAO|nr:hypothetical protein [Flavivirga eckloniae]AUP80225.1 hypothetical protein C1H87_16520 [Flavivirga eckloniae]
MNNIKYIVICFLIVVSCSDDDVIDSTLSAYIQGRTIEMGGVIACAASDETNGDVLTFYYPEAGASNIRFYQTNNVSVDNSNFLNYSRVVLNNAPFFNGYLGKFTQSASVETWNIVTFELDGEIKISNPIRTKQISKPTLWNDEVVIDQGESGMPKFMWIDNAVDDNAIYFQVISDAQNNLLSGTYTYENNFQYYETNNVVLNITTQTPATLTLNNTYNFTLMDVSEDNWVNLVINKTFIAQ